MEEQLREMGRHLLVPINKDAGCISAYFLEPSIENDNPSFGVVSIWPDKENMSPLIETLTDRLYLTV
jgi:hypothetical protein